MMADNRPRSYDGIVVAQPYTESYVRRSGKGAAWFIGRVLAGILREAKLPKTAVDGLIVSSNHGIFQSIYFFDPNGHRLELVANTRTREQLDELKRVAPAMLEEWNRTKKAPKHAAWLHELEFAGDTK